MHFPTTLKLGEAMCGCDKQNLSKRDLYHLHNGWCKKAHYDLLCFLFLYTIPKLVAALSAYMLEWGQMTAELPAHLWWTYIMSNNHCFKLLRFWGCLVSQHNLTNPAYPRKSRRLYMRKDLNSERELALQRGSTCKAVKWERTQYVWSRKDSGMW